VAWKELLDTLNQGRADIIISSITKRKDRERDYKIRFSDSYFCTTQSLIYHDNTSEQPISELIANKRVGFQEKTTSELLVSALKRGVPFDARPFNQVDDIVQALLRSEIDYGVTDTPFAVTASLTKGPNKIGYKKFNKSDFPASVPEAERVEEYAIAVREGNTELLDVINAILTKLKEDGRLMRLFDEATREYENAKKIAPGARVGELKREHPWKC
jgi:arginine/lysine/histidine transporter system substrate-binding protein